MGYGTKLVCITVLAIAGLSYLLVNNPASSQRGSNSDLPVSQQVLTLYCAAGIKPAVLKATQAFQQEYGVQVNIEYGGSGTLLSRIEIAPVGDLYIAADSSYIDKAKEKGLVDERLPLAKMKPVIAVQKGNPKGIMSVSDLARPDVKLALGNPGASSIGRQTKILLEKVDFWEAVEDNATKQGVFKPTVPEIANDVKLGVVDAAVVWDATVNQYPELEAISVPEFNVAEKNVTIAVLKSSKNPTTALRLARYLNSVEGNKIFKESGFVPVVGDDWAWEPEITFYCGSLNRRAIKDAIKDFQKREGVIINTKYNGCGILTSDMKLIKSGSSVQNFPDVYMACDRYYLDNVSDWFQEDTNVSQTEIVIVVPKGNPANIKRLRDLAKPGVKLSLGQPEQCTIGALSKILLVRAGIYDQVMNNVAVQTASSAMLIPTVVKTKHMETVLDATLAYKVDTMDVSDQVDVIPIRGMEAMAIQPFSLSTSSNFKFLGRRLKQKIIRSEADFDRSGFEFLAK